MLAAVTVIIVVCCWADSSRQHEHVCLLEDQEEPCVGHKPLVGNVDIKGPVIFKKRQQRASQKDGTELQSLSQFYVLGRWHHAYCIIHSLVHPVNKEIIGHLLSARHFSRHWGPRGAQDCCGFWFQSSSWRRTQTKRGRLPPV